MVDRPPWRRLVALAAILPLLGGVVGGCAGPEGPPGPVGPAGEAGPPGAPADRGLGPDAALDMALDAATALDAMPDMAPDRDVAPDAAPDPDMAPDAAPEPDMAPDAAPEPCPPWTPPPGLGGVAHGIVDEVEARRWLAFRAAREQERLREALDPAGVAARYRVEQADIERGCVDTPALVDLGRGLFMRRFTLAEGFGNALAGVDGTDAGDRPPPNLRRLQKGHFGGPDAARCTDCHWKGGFAGGGDRVDNSFLYGDGVDLETHDPRNPPALWGAGWTERIAVEMSEELAAIAADARARAAAGGAPVEVALTAKGVFFGRVVAHPDGRLDTARIEGVDPDLVVKPFGWKGVFATLRDFVAHSLHIHFNLQAESLVAAPGELNLGEGPDALDPDADGVTREITDGQLTALVAFLATLDAPRMEVPVEGGFADPFAPELPAIIDAPEFALRWAEGAEAFADLGCAGCHVPLMTVRDPALDIGGVTIDLAVEGALPRPGFDGEVYVVPVFSDFKRHDMGPLLAARHPERAVAPERWMTRRLWAVGQTGPYLHDGSAATVDEAIARHGGEAAFAAAAWLEAPESVRSGVRVFLSALRRAPSIRIR